MDKQLRLHELVKEELNRNEELHDLLETELRHLPKGSLLDRNGHLYRAFRENGVQYQKPIKNDKRLLQNLKLRSFIKNALPYIKNRVAICRMFLANDSFYDPVKIEHALREIYQGIDDRRIFLEGDIGAEEWENEKYFRNKYPFREEHFTDGGIQVRSKAEAMIGTQIEHRDMVFRCEPERYVEGVRVYPDFEIFLPYRRRRVYLEHFGKMDSPEYLRKAMYKIANYHKAGLLSGVNFFFTWETRDKPLNILEINEVLDEIELLDK